MTDSSRDPSIDIAGLSAQEKRALLSRLLMERAAASASAHPLSYGQRSLWFLYQLAPDNPAYTLTYAGRVSGDLDVAALERAAQALVERHAILRTTFAVRDGQPVQLVHPHWPVRIARQDVGPHDIDEWIHRESDGAFDLQTGPVFRLTLLRQSPHEHVLVLAVHHIAADFWSIDVILDELCKLYAAQRGSDAPPVCPERYVGYADRQLQLMSGAEGIASGSIGVTSWPASYPNSVWLPTGRDRRRRRITVRCNVSVLTAAWRRDSGGGPRCRRDTVHDLSGCLRHAVAPLHRPGRPPRRLTIRMPRSGRDGGSGRLRRQHRRLAYRLAW
ncbi:hypothetical protein NIIDMKKI_12260 [Mycobacterium kansasii]|uniref:Condensation domain-containing protein n=1 Tax=Mycobacterium kansasii TaxID=1768 RepID=A0A7G1I4U4_MYCKA|nr:hypothetical protein NIIDMKKI_12260 [Mycobacterium kansasii]